MSDLEALIADLLAEEVRAHARSVGVLVRDVPHLAAGPILAALAGLIEQGVELRVAYLLDGGALAAAEAELTADVFDTSVEQAERWRNEPGLQATIVVIADGTESRLSSLQDFQAIGPLRLKRRLADRGIGKFGDTNDVQRQWWELLKKDTRVSLTQLSEYYLALRDLPKAEVITLASRDLGLLGLLPDPELFNRPNQIGRRLDANRQLVTRLQTLSEKDRLAIAQTIASEDDPEARRRLNKTFHRLRQMRRDSTADLLAVAEAQELLGLRRGTPAERSARGRTREQKQTVTDYAAQALLDESGDEDEGTGDQILAGLTSELDEIAESSLKPERIGVELETGLVLQTQARTDLVNLIIRLVGPGAYGGWVRSQGDTIDEMIRRFQGDEQVVQRWTRETIDDFLASSDDAATVAIRGRFDAFDAARTACLPHVRALCVDPMAVAAAPTARAQLLALISRYQELLEALESHNQALAAVFGSEVDSLIGALLVLDVVVFEGDDRTLALLSPLHPLYLWHFAEFCRIVAEQRASLSERDRNLVRDAAAQLPNFLNSLCLPPITQAHAESLPHIGRVGPLPYYGGATEISVSDDGVVALGELVRAFLRVHPPARYGLRLTLLDPPDPSPYLILMCDLADEEELEGAHVTVIRHPRDKVANDLNLDASEEERVAERFSATSDDRRFTLDFETVPETRLLEDAPVAHIAAVFDQTPGQRDRVQPVDQPIQPLTLTRRLQYLRRRQTVELVPAPGGVFAAYFGVARHLSNALSASHFTLHQDDELRARLRAAAAESQWFVFADRNVDRDLEASSLRIFTTREGDRDIAGFTNTTDPFRRALKDVAVRYNTAISDRELEGLLHELTDLLDVGVLWLRPGADGASDHARVKGVLGTLIACRWYRHAADKRRMVISLDDPAARKWLHLSDDPKRADLLGIEAKDGTVEVSILEVKAVDAAGTEYRVANGVVQGDAVSQVLSTRRLLAEVFAGEQEGELITTPARRELLRANAFRELTKSRYSPEERQAWVNSLEAAFAGELTVEVTAQLVDVRIGVDPATLPTPQNVVADDQGEQVAVTITVLNEHEVVELRQPPRQESASPTPQPEQSPPDTPIDDERAAASHQERGENVPRSPASSETPDDTVNAASDVSPTEQPVVDRPRAFLGTGPGPYGRPRDIYFDPELPEAPLANPHLSITGETGSGKTQATKALLRDLVGVDGLPVLILDFKDDYSSIEYVDTEGFTVYDMSFGGLPFNPLEPPRDLRTGQVAPMNHVHQLSEIIKRVYKLGDQQAFHLREAVKAAYEAEDIPTTPFAPSADTTWPPFEAVRPLLAAGDHSALLGRLSPIFDLGLFAANADVGIAGMLDGRTVVRLSQLPGDQVKNAVAEILLLALYNHLIRQPQPRRLTRLLVLDEAWRVTNSPWLEPLMREGRSLGLGVIVATQYPSDLTDAIAGATNTKLYFSQSLPEPIREIQRTLVGKTSGQDADRIGAEVRGLPPLTCLLANRQHDPYIRVSIEPYFRRVAPP